ncbi:putative prophage repressor [Thermosipho africanus Ob7]|nr:putative prophage repressor [Thermosipho africanus Ob7]
MYVKCCVKDNTKIIFLSENPLYCLIIVEPDNRFIILGVVIDIKIEKTEKND